jgi:hypothetical protein
VALISFSLKMSKLSTKKRASRTILLDAQIAEKQRNSRETILRIVAAAATATGGKPLVKLLKRA